LAVENGETSMSDESRILRDLADHLDQCLKMEVDVETALILGNVTEAERILDGLFIKGRQFKESLISLLVENKEKGNYKQAKNMLGLINIINEFESTIITIQNTIPKK
jgi:hypothetical protein